MISIIAAVSYNDVVGKDNSLPWGRIPSDMKWFKRHTTDNVVVMGRKTWESIGAYPLPNRLNYVVTSNPTINNVTGVISNNIIKNIKYLESYYPNKKIFVIGGPKLYNEVASIADEFIITRIKEYYEGDAFFNPFIHMQRNFSIAESVINVERSNDAPAHSFYIYRRD